jgi:hypothetical protein
MPLLLLNADEGMHRYQTTGTSNSIVAISFHIPEELKYSYFKQSCLLEGYIYMLMGESCAAKV